MSLTKTEALKDGVIVPLTLEEYIVKTNPGISITGLFIRNALFDCKIFIIIFLATESSTDNLELIDLYEDDSSASPSDLSYNASPSPS